MKKILVLEDESNIRSFVVINLKRSGYEPIEAENGIMALEKQKVNPDDLGAVQRHYDGLSDEKRNGYFERRFPDYIAEFGNKAALEDEQEARYDELLKLRQPVPHRYVLEAR